MHSIMIVDDEYVIIAQLEESLTSMGYPVVGHAFSGKEALELAERLKPSLILMDIVMPGEWSGIAAAEIIRAKLNIPVVFLTAYADDELIQQATKVEPVGYIVKPFRKDELKAIIEVALHKAEMEQRLRESEEKYRMIAETSMDGIYQTDNAGMFVFVNKACETILGYGQKEMLGQHFEVVIPAQNRAAATTFFEKVTLGESIQNEIILKRKDGQNFWAYFSTAPITKDGMFIGTTGIVRDITASKETEKALRQTHEDLEVRVVERTTELAETNKSLKREIDERKRVEEQIKASLKEKEVMLQEIHHRVKNNLQVISSLLYLQAKQIKDQQTLALFEESRNRVKSMALIHEKLYEAKDLSRINFAGYVRNLTNYLLQSYKVSVQTIALKININNVFLDVNTAIPCGLIINELVSNALKYAFPDTENQPAGQTREINIDLWADDEQRLTLIVSDNGIGLPPDMDLQNTETLGFQLVSALTNQLDGSSELDGTEGTKIKISFIVQNDKAAPKK